MHKIPSFVTEQMPALQALCMQYGVRHLSLFGSALTPGFNESRSDLDFLVEFTNPEQQGIATRFMGLAEALELLFGRSVDLITTASVRNPIFREQVNRNQQTLYAA
jgi:hypothetical protein